MCCIVARSRLQILARFSTHPLRNFQVSFSIPDLGWFRVGVGCCCFVWWLDYGGGGGRRERVALQRVPDVFGRFLLTTLTVGGVAEVFFFCRPSFWRFQTPFIAFVVAFFPPESFDVVSRRFPSLPVASRRFPSLPVVSRRFPPLQLFYHQPPQSIQWPTSGSFFRAFIIICIIRWLCRTILKLMALSFVTGPIKIKSCFRSKLVAFQLHPLSL